jgi:hypothetical protein
MIHAGAGRRQTEALQRLGPRLDALLAALDLGILLEKTSPLPPGSLEGCQRKGDAGKAVCKLLKTKGRQIALA